MSIFLYTNTSRQPLRRDFSPSQFQGKGFLMTKRQQRQPAGHPANSTRYKRLRADFFRSWGPTGVCWICQKTVNMSLTGRSKWGRSVDHEPPISAGGNQFDVSSFRLAHRSCNSAKGRGPGPQRPRSPNS